MFLPDLFLLINKPALRLLPCRFVYFTHPPDVEFVSHGSSVSNFNVAELQGTPVPTTSIIHKNKNEKNLKILKIIHYITSVFTLKLLPLPLYPPMVPTRFATPSRFHPVTPFSPFFRLDPVRRGYTCLFSPP